MKSGSVALYSNQTAGAYFDMVYIEPLDCFNKIEAKSEYDFVPEESNRFLEIYKGGPMELRWKHKDPPEMVDGPGVWEVVKNKFGRARVIS